MIRSVSFMTEVFLSWLMIYEAPTGRKIEEGKSPRDHCVVVSGTVSRWVPITDSS